jgi:Protein of unknown function (DUF1566)
MIKTTHENASFKDPNSRLDWRCKSEGALSFKDAIAKFEKPDGQGWRIPTLYELKTLIANRAITGNFLDRVGVFYSSTTLDEQNAFVLDVQDESSYKDSRRKNVTCNVRLVR